MDSQSQPDVIAMAQVGLTALVTSCSGVLIALLAFVGQAKELSPVQAFHAGWVAGAAGAGLWMAVLACLLGYLNTGVMWIGQPSRWLWWAAFGAFAASLALLGVALIQSACLVAA